MKSCLFVCARGTPSCSGSVHALPLCRGSLPPLHKGSAFVSTLRAPSLRASPFALFQNNYTATADRREGFDDL